MDLLDKAIQIATEAHEGQKDKGGNDYILHPLRVASKLNTEDEKIVAILHDTIEDTEVTYDYLREEGFSINIINAIHSVTRKEGEAYTDFIKRCKENPIGKNVKLADLEDNINLKRIKSPTQKDLNRVEKYKKAKIELLKEDL